MVRLPRIIRLRSFIALLTALAGANSFAEEEPPIMAPEKEGPAMACGEAIEPESAEPPPALTAKLLSLAAEYPELQEDLERTHQCVSQDEGGCEGRKTITGGDELANTVSALNLKNEKDQKNFMKLVKEKAPEDARDYQTVVTQRGFRRQVVLNSLLYGISDHSHFHLHAGGIDQVHADALAKERKAQARLLEIFAEIEGQLDPKKDGDSLQALAFYQGEAKRSEKNLGLLTCELDRMTEKNYEIERRMTAIISGQGPDSSVTGQAPAQGRYLGGGKVSGNADPAPGAGRSLASDQSAILDAVPAFRDAPHASQRADVSYFGESLFRRVHRKYRELDARDAFRPGLWEVAPPAQFP